MMAKHEGFDILSVITTPKLADRATQILAGEGIAIEYRLAAVGTATSEIMDVLGLGSIDKVILFSLLPKSKCGEMMNKMSKALVLHAVNSGIAFTVPLTGMNSLMLRMLTDIDGSNEERKEETAMPDTKYSVIASIINRGYSNELMDAAREAGASGGTVVNSRRIAEEALCSKWGLGAQEEKEIVLIVANAEKKVDIMKKISEKCGAHSEAKGVVFSLAIEEVIGLSGNG